MTLIYFIRLYDDKDDDDNEYHDDDDDDDDVDDLAYRNADEE